MRARLGAVPTIAAALTTVMGLAALVSCGGGNGPHITGITTTTICGLAEQKSWLLADMQDVYLFADRLPSVDPAPFGTIESYFDALLVKKDLDGITPLDQWSYVQDSASYNLSFSAGQTLNYGVTVAGRPEDPSPIRIRYIAPHSPAEAAGLQRGMVLESINGVPTSTMQAAGAFPLLTPSVVGQSINLSVRDSVTSLTPRSVRLTAAVYDLSPVDTRYSRVLHLPHPANPSAAPTAVGYVFYKDFLNGYNPDGSLRPDLTTQLAQFKAQGVTELVLDLRYNGGGYINLAQDLASAIGGSALDNRIFGSLHYNARHSASNGNYLFQASTSTALNLSRVYVLTGRRTCSASELVINGLSPHIQVIQIGNSSCGKPFGFQPQSYCQKTYSALRFEVFNSAAQGRYYNGLAPTPGCTVADNFDLPLGTDTEALTHAALTHIQTGTCPAVASANPTPLGRRTRSQTPSTSPTLLEGDGTPGGMR
ncbi:S41 family peptidase [Leptothrix ochracea]|uniref:S41 family peptidase n=1 Tax=Leptothrix ochracea TaxID=735331 RepID=UPI0034E29A2F